MKYFLAIVIILLVTFGIWFAWNANFIAHETENQVTWNNATANDIVVEKPVAGATVASSFTLSGKARGNWYFEASFPVEVIDEAGNQLFQGPVQAKGEWMTTDFVPFSTTVTISGAYRGPATLILKNDNASGLPEHDKSVSIPIVIK